MATPTEAELRLLKVLWRDGQLSAREIQTRVETETDWSLSTTRKMLDRMAEKGLVRIESVHGMKTFIASQSRLKTMAGLIRRFSQSILDTDEPLPAATFVRSRLIDADEVEELEALLQDLDEEEGK